MRDASEQADPLPSLEPGPERPVARERERPLPEPREGIGEADDVLPFFERADAEDAGRSRRAFGDREVLAIDPARDDLHLLPRLGQLRLELALQVARDADHGFRAAYDEAGRSRHARKRADVPDVPPVRGDDERRAAGEGGNQAGGDEEVRVHDVRPRRGEGPPRQRQVAELPARARVEDGQLDLVASRDELPLDLRDERPEVGRSGAWVHLRDEQDAHGASVRGPRATSSASGPTRRRRCERRRRRSRTGLRRAGRAGARRRRGRRDAEAGRRGASRPGRRHARP